MSLPANRCCCKIKTDDFNRAGPGYGSDWHKESGTDPTIITNELDFSAPAILRLLTAHPDGPTGAAHVKGKIKVHADGDAVELLAGWLDSSNYVFSRVTYSAAGCSYLRVGSVIAGVESHEVDIPLDGLTPDVQHTPHLCWFPKKYGSTGVILGFIELANGKVFGYEWFAFVDLGAYAAAGVTAGGAKVDDFFYGKAAGTGCSATCPDCNTPCHVSDDDFNRADSADNVLGCKWAVYDGHQKILSSQWKITANDSRAEHLVPHPQRKSALIAGVDMLDVAGQIGRLYLGGAYLQYEPSVSGHTLSIYDGAGGPGTPTGTRVGIPVTDSTPATGAMVTLTVCNDGHATYPSGTKMTASAPRLCTDEMVQSAGQFAFIGGSNGTILDNFTLGKYRTQSPFFPADPNCPVCLCVSPPVPCSNCCSSPQPAGNYIIDLEAGGWSTIRCLGEPFGTGGDCGSPATLDSACSFCDGVTGEYVLDASGGCTWIYRQNLACEEGFGIKCCTFCEGRDPEMYFLIVLTLGVADNGLCRWKCTVGMYNPSFDPVLAGCACSYCDGGVLKAFTSNKVATYYSDYLPDKTRCNTFPVVLTKDTETGDYPCGGTLPTAITLNSAV